MRLRFLLSVCLVASCLSPIELAHAANPSNGDTEIQGVLHIEAAYLSVHGGTEENVTQVIKELCEEKGSCDIPISGAASAKSGASWHLKVIYVCEGLKREMNAGDTQSKKVKVSCPQKWKEGRGPVSTPVRKDGDSPPASVTTEPPGYKQSQAPAARQEQQLTKSASLGEGEGITGGCIPPGDSTLDIETAPSNAAFYVFSGHTYVFSGVTPFRNTSVLSGEYNICFEKAGYDLFWKTVGIAGPSTPISVSLRAVEKQGLSTGCAEANRKATSATEEEVTEKALKDAAQKAERDRICRELSDRLKTVQPGTRERTMLVEEYLGRCSSRAR